MVPMTDASLQDEVERLRAENAALERRVSRRIRLRAAASWLLLVLGCGLAVLSLVADLAAGDAARHRPLRRHGRADRRRAGGPGRGRGQARDRDLLAGRLRRARSRGAARPRRRARAGDPDRRAVGHLATGSRSSRARSASRTSGSRPTGARTRASWNCSRAGARAGSCSTTTRVYLDLSAAVDRVQTGLAGARAGPDREPRSRRASTAASSSCSRRGWCNAQRGVRLLKAVAIVLPLLALLCLVGSVFLARQRRRGAAAGRDRPGGGDAAADRGARRRALGLPGRARPRARSRTTPLRASSTRSSRCCATASGSSSSPRSWWR